MNIKIALCVFVLIFVVAVFYRINLKTEMCMPANIIRWIQQKSIVSQTWTNPIKLSPVMFVESTETLTPQPLAICAVESAARIYQDRPIYFFLKGFKTRTCLHGKTECPGLRLLAAFPNLELRHLDPKVVLDGTPLLTWYDEDKVYKEIYWIRNTANAYRLALIWKYGGLYFDTDVITIKRTDEDNFVACEENGVVCNAVFGFHHHNPYIMDCMTDFVMNYNGLIWGHQGPELFTRVIKKSCSLTNFIKVQDFSCDVRNMTVMHPTRFYPFHWSQWEKYFEVWKDNSTFRDSYGLHLWNFLKSKENRRVVSGSNTLVENLFLNYCPKTYDILIKNVQN